METPANLFAGDTDTLIKWLTNGEQGQPRPKVISFIRRPDDDEEQEELGAGAAATTTTTDPAWRLFHDPRLGPPLFQIKQWISGQSHPGWVFEDIMTQMFRYSENTFHQLHQTMASEKKKKENSILLKKKKKKILASNKRRRKMTTTIPEGTAASQKKDKQVLDEASSSSEEEQFSQGMASSSEKKLVLQGTTPDEENNKKQQLLEVEATTSEEKKMMMGFPGGMASDKMMGFSEEASSTSKLKIEFAEGMTSSQKKKFRKQNKKLLEQLEGVAIDSMMKFSEMMASEMGFPEGMAFEEKMEIFLKDKSYLIVLDDVPDESLWRRIESAFPGNTAHSAILLTTRSPAVAYSCSPHDRVFPPLDPLIDFFHTKAVSIVENNPNKGDLDEVIRSILSKCASNSTDMCLRAFLHVLYANPNRNREELQSLCDSLHDSHGLMLDENMQQILMFWYNDLPIHYKSCLMYLSIFLQDDGSNGSSTMMIRRTSLVRRWAAESMITGRDGLAALDEAERCFDVLLAKRFVLERDIGASGKVKSCAVNGLISKFITKVAREDNFVDADLQLDFVHRVSIQNRSQLKQVLAELQASPHPNSSCWNICKHLNESKEEDGQPLDDLTMFLESLPAFSQLGLLKVLDLEGCDVLKEHHLENICKLFQLRYLNLRRSKITRLPNKIQNLQQLETLDIRETAVSSFATKSLVLPMLKHLLSGYTHQQNDQKTETFSTVRMPRGIGRMTNLQILCHVDVSGKEDELMGIGKLLQLRKLGVVFHGDQNNFKHLVQAIEKLNRSLISLSIRVQVPDGQNSPDMSMAEPTAFSFPKFLESLNIWGIKSGLPRWIKELSRLAKLTLCETHLVERDITVVGNLKALQYLRLMCKSYVQSKLTLGEKQFQHLKVLLIHGEEIADISFNKNPKLEKIVWGFREMKSISGIERLPSLRSLELHGDCNPDKVEIALKDHPNHPDLKHHGNRQGHVDASGSMDAAAASTSAFALASTP